MTYQDYITGLKTHDWHWAYSDDFRAYEKGRAQWLQLLAYARIHDRTYATWNTYAPASHRMVAIDESVAI